MLKRSAVSLATTRVLAYLWRWKYSVSVASTVAGSSRRALCHCSGGSVITRVRASGSASSAPAQSRRVGCTGRSAAMRSAAKPMACSEATALATVEPVFTGSSSSTAMPSSA